MIEEGVDQFRSGPESNGGFSKLGFEIRKLLWAEVGKEDTL